MRMGAGRAVAMDDKWIAFEVGSEGKGGLGRIFFLVLFWCVHIRTSSCLMMRGDDEPTPPLSASGYHSNSP